MAASTLQILKEKLSGADNVMLSTYWREARQWDLDKLGDDTELEKMILSIDDDSKNMPLAIIVIAISTEISERFSNQHL